jgi:hypothetical protein
MIDSRGIKMQVMFQSNMYKNRKNSINTLNQSQILNEGPNTPYACQRQQLPQNRITFPGERLL